MNVPDRITVWACPVCGYWRASKTGGDHVASNPEDPRGPLVIHTLVETTYVLPVNEKDAA